MTVRALGYVGLESADLAGWTRFATDVLGLAVAPHSSDEVVQLKMDDWAQRYTVTPGERDRLAYLGWQLATAADFDTICAAVTAGGTELTEGTPDELDRRHVRAMAWCLDPSGIRHELFHTPIADHVRFQSPAGVPAFVTGDLGVGHAVLLCSDVDGSFRFATELLGLRLSDQMVLDGRPLRFLRCNPRHHSLALAPHHTSRLAHLMFEVETIDEVGRGLDRCADHGGVIAQTLGRHTNDRMTSFYMKAPRGYEVEYGCDGLRVDEATWATAEITAVSFWGHRRPT